MWIRIPHSSRPWLTHANCKVMAEIRKLTILHSNDPHGAFYPEEKNGKSCGGISFLAGKLSQIRKEEENCLYVIAGDLFKGSLIDHDYKGISTIELINLLEPDVVTIGNHGVDYGIGHLLFLEKCARFDIINANMYVTGSKKRLFEPYKIITIGGMKVMFIGLVTMDVLLSAKGEDLVFDYLRVDDALYEIKTILDAYRTVDVDLTVLVTHIGYEQDKVLAEKIDPKLGIDLIIGAHSHTLLKKPKVVNGIPIVQVGSGFEHLGRFDLAIDTSEHKLKDLKWSLIDIDSDTCKKDALMEAVLEAYAGEVKLRSEQVLTTFRRQLSHPSRSRETELSNLFADLMKEDSSFDVMMLGTGCFRAKKLGPVVDYLSFKEAYPFDNAIYMMEVDGALLRKICHHFLKGSYVSEGSSEYFAFSKGMKAVYDAKTDELIECSYNGKELNEDDHLKLALQEFHLNNCEEFLGVSLEELSMYKAPVLVVNSDVMTYEELLRSRFELDAKTEGRTKILK